MAQALEAICIVAMWRITQMGGHVQVWGSMAGLHIIA